jgi:hypothetical protein
MIIIGTGTYGAHFFLWIKGGRPKIILGREDDIRVFSDLVT